MIQTILITLLFLGAVGYLARLLFVHFSGQQNCPKGCGNCSAVDIEKIKKELQEKQSA